ncbi:hypothetical protein LOD99_6783 [Oopsacas minuta]|uniref:Alpha-1,3-glucosyltransferase n=1 Tax=Oopsacas minuta TaxID=111878 RepID=A0AAV7JJT4_9METZ|nr:hypothetical protein LOD99_6783 [Oopsacas minuta]
MYSTVITTGVVITCIKLLLMPAYHSTDFEVHRNWLAITSSLPLEEWYYNNDSIWTLDYPPLFAYFEFLLSKPATMVDPNITRLDNHEYANDNCVTFQRISVVASDLILIIATDYYVSTLTDRVKHRSIALALLIVCNSGLLIVDHIHFQYNGMLFGILIFSLVAMKREWFITAAALFTILLFFKHIFVYFAFAYFIYLLTHYCLYTSHTRHSLVTIATLRFIALSLTVLSISFVSLLPFISQLSQLLSRLFPFRRGLTHAYWAPNAWALYNTADIILSKLFISNSNSSLTRGLVGDGTHTFLPSVTPLATLVCTLVSMLPGMLIGMRVNRVDNPFVRFVTSLTLCGFSSFLFGWHVHEKAILLVIIPFTLIAIEHPSLTPIYTLLSAVGVFSLFPLVIQLREIPIKICLFLLNISFCHIFLPKCVAKANQLSLLELCYLSGLLPLICLDIFGGYLATYQFIPLMMTSLYCAVGNFYVYFKICLFAIQLCTS